VNSLGLTEPERTWWTYISGSPTLEDKTVDEFLEREDVPAQGRMLRYASLTDGTHTLTIEQSEMLADALVARLRRGVLCWAPLFELGLRIPFLAAPPPLPSAFLPPFQTVACLRLWPRALTWPASLPRLPRPPARCAVHELTLDAGLLLPLRNSLWHCGKACMCRCPCSMGQSLDGRTTSCTRARVLSYHPNCPPPPSFWWGITLPCKLLVGVFLGVACPPCSPGVNSCQHRPPELFTRVCCVRCAHGLPVLPPPPLTHHPSATAGQKPPWVLTVQSDPTTCVCLV
jgi:hypothetical protein